MAKRKPGKKVPVNKLLLFALAVIAALSLYIWFKHRSKIKPRPARFVNYPNFGIDLPEGYKIHGIDVSNYQGIINWSRVAAMRDKDVDIDFAFIKATEGIKSVDRRFKRNWQEAKTANVKRGAYHFFLATKSGRLQAQNFIKTVKLEPGDLPPVLDVEELYGVRPDSMRSRVASWLRTVEAAYGVKPIIYTGASFYKNFLGHEFDDYPLWVAHYFVKQKPGVNDGWYFWQHSAAGRVNGIQTRVDFNVFSGDSTLFNSLLLPLPTARKRR